LSSETIHSQRMPHKGEFSEHLVAPGDVMTSTEHQYSPPCPYLPHTHTNTHTHLLFLIRDEYLICNWTI